MNVNIPLYLLSVLVNNLTKTSAIFLIMLAGVYSKYGFSIQSKYIHQISCMCFTVFSSSKANHFAFWSLPSKQSSVHSRLTWSLERDVCSRTPKNEIWGKMDTVFQENHLTGDGCGEQKKMKKEHGDTKNMTGRRRRGEREASSLCHQM